MTASPAPSTAARVETGLVRAHGYAALVTLLIAVTFGIVVSLQFIAPDISGGSLSFGWGRLRYAHTQGIMLGWLGNAFLAFMYHAVPVLTGSRVASRTLGIWIFAIWNFAVMLPGWILVLSGISQPLEWAEFPLVTDLFVVIALALAAAQFLPPFFRGSLEKLYVSSWYIIGGLVFTLLAYPMGNIAPELVPGAAGAAISGLWIHDAVGLFVTPLALAIIYYVIPASTGRPIYSHFLSMLGFWGLFFWYPLNGTHHYIFSVIPMEAQLTAIAASALLGVVVVLVVTNLMMSRRGFGIFPREIGLRFIIMSVIYYIIVSIQGALQAQMALNQRIHFSDWVVGHSHLAMMGFATFAGIGGIVHAWQRMPGVRYNASALNWAYWLLFLGISVMVIDLTIAGVMQGQMWQGSLPWIESVRASAPYWQVRSVTAIPIAAGFVLVLAGLTTGPRGAGRDAIERVAVDRPVQEVSPTLSVTATGTAAGRGLAMAYVVACVAGVGFFALSVSLLGAWPSKVLAEQTTSMAPAAALPLTPAEARGRVIYAREGCAYCHTQQIRYLASDIERFGAPTLAWESRFDYPHMMGTRRIGPDLSRAGGTRTENWHFVHLFAPRAVVPLSIMPSYAALFDGAPNRPKQDARDLVAYVESLGRARELAWPDGDQAARAGAGDNRWALMSLDAPLLNAHPARTRPLGQAPMLPGGQAVNAGSQLWTDHCAGCHGAGGKGDGPASAWLRPAPVDLTARRYDRDHLGDILWNGVHNTAMPAWRALSGDDRAALAAVVAAFSNVGETPAISPAQRALGEAVYIANCVECHGEGGAGDGFAADQFPVAPTNFTVEQPSLEEALRILQNGVPGTSMALWTDRLEPTGIEAVARYVLQFYKGREPGREQAP